MSNRVSIECHYISPNVDKITRFGEVESISHRIQPAYYRAYQVYSQQTLQMY